MVANGTPPMMSMGNLMGQLQAMPRQGEVSGQSRFAALHPVQAAKRTVRSGGQLAPGGMQKAMAQNQAMQRLQGRGMSRMQAARRTGQMPTMQDVVGARFGNGLAGVLRNRLGGMNPGLPGAMTGQLTAMGGAPVQRQPFGPQGGAPSPFQAVPFRSGAPMSGVGATIGGPMTQPTMNGAPPMSQVMPFRSL